MATYRIKVNERTKAGKDLVNYLRGLGVLEEPNEETIAAFTEIRGGSGTRCSSFDEYLKTVSKL